MRATPLYSLVSATICLACCAPIEGDQGPAEDPDEIEISGQSQNLAIASQNGADLKWNATERKNLTFCVEQGDSLRYPGFASYTNAVIAAAGRAASAWASIADVKFRYVQGEDACDYCDPRAAGKNPCPAASKVPSLFAIVPDAARSRTNFLPNLSPEGDRLLMLRTEDYEDSTTLEDTLVHEFGHVLGFLHEHQRTDIPKGVRSSDCRAGDIDPTQYPFTARGLTAYDRYSAMHYPAWGAYVECGGREDIIYYDLSFSDAMGAPCVYGNPGSGNIPNYCDLLTVMPAVESPYVSATAPLMLPVLNYVDIVFPPNPF